MDQILYFQCIFSLITLCLRYAKRKSVLKTKLKYVYTSLLQIEEWEDSNSQAGVRELRIEIESSDFVANLIFLGDIMHLLKPLATILQSQNIDLCASLEQVKEYSK